MVQRGNGPNLAVEALAEALGGNLNRDVAARAGIMRAENLAHAAFANRRKNLVRPKLVTRSQRHMTDPAKFT
jgi:hypothetical protein